MKFFELGKIAPKIAEREREREKLFDYSHIFLLKVVGFTFVFQDGFNACTHDDVELTLLFPC